MSVKFSIFRMNMTRYFRPGFLKWFSTPAYGLKWALVCISFGLLWSLFIYFITIPDENVNFSRCYWGKAIISDLQFGWSKISREILCWFEERHLSRDFIFLCSSIWIIIVLHNLFQFKNDGTMIINYSTCIGMVVVALFLTSLFVIMVLCSFYIKNHIKNSNISARTRKLHVR